jgi:hypothetical protein
MTDNELVEIERRAVAAAPGPWFARATDDGAFMNARYVGLDPIAPDDHDFRHDELQGMSEGEGKSNRVIAITLLQYPRLADGPNEDENTEFIAHAREDVPRLVAEVRRLRAELAGR